mgnify:CR=1 FL=1
MVKIHKKPRSCEEGGEKERTNVTAQSIQPNSDNNLSTLSLSELNELLKEVLEHEDYMRAIDIRDEIAKRNEQKKS